MDVASPTAMRTVLTVDDSRVVRSLLALHLTPCGFRVVEAESGRDGIAAARTHKPDLILLDISMPDMTGPEALAELRKDPQFQKTPVIMLTAENRREDVVECAKLGVAGYILKPYNRETLQQEVSKALGATVMAPAANDTAQDEGDAVPTANGASETVLVVDDSERVLALARAALEKTMTVLTAATAKQAAERYEAARPSVVVVDLSMPDMDGFETLAVLKELGSSAWVALAVRGDAEARAAALKAGYHAVVDKPFQAADLLNEVAAAMSVVVPPEKLLARYVTEEDGCAVFTLPDVRATIFTRVLPLLAEKLRGLAEEGYDRLILDMAEAGEVGDEQASSIGTLFSQARSLGIRTAICTPHKEVAECFQKVDDAKDVPSVESRDAARQCFE